MLNLNGVAIFMAILLMALSYIFKRPQVALAAAGAWIVAAVAAYGSSVTAWDMWYGMFWFNIAMVIVAAFEAFYSREKKVAEPPQVKTDMDTYLDDYERRIAETERVRELRARRTNPRRRQSGYSNYAKTGRT